MSEHTKYLLGEDRIPHAWYNIIADLPSPPPPVLHPGTGKPVGPDDLSPLFPMALIGQEVSGERHIEIEAGPRPSPHVGGRRRSIAPGGWRKRWAQMRAFSTNTRASAGRQPQTLTRRSSGFLQ